jgi:hypothetical protein
LAAIIGHGHCGPVVRRRSSYDRGIGPHLALKFAAAIEQDQPWVRVPNEDVTGFPG